MAGESDDISHVAEQLGRLTVNEGTPSSLAASAADPSEADSASRIYYSANALAETPDRARTGAGSTLIVFPPICRQHNPETSHQECAHRLDVICGEHGVLRRDEFAACQWQEGDEVPPAQLVDILRVHDVDYVRHVEATCRGLHERELQRVAAGAAVEELHAPHSTLDPAAPSALARASREWQPNAVTGSAVPGRSLIGSEHEPPSGVPTHSLDADTTLSARSFDAAVYGCGAVIAAVDAVVTGAAPNAFCVVRPPGHHAGPFGAVPSDNYPVRGDHTSNGFCVFNNVAVGAAYARAVHGRPRVMQSHGRVRSEPGPIQRVAVVDFDIHHGNGTEEIVKCLAPHEQKLPLPPGWPPQTRHVHRPWLNAHDAENVFFASVHLYASGEFYPDKGSKALDPPLHVLNLPLPPHPAFGTRPTGRALAAARRICRNYFRTRVEGELVPALREFNPDLILLSSGFDAHTDDLYYHLTEDDYRWFTRQMKQVARECCEGRLVSVLEGGYAVAETEVVVPRTPPKGEADAWAPLGRGPDRPGTRSRATGWRKNAKTGEWEGAEPSGAAGLTADGGSQAGAAPAPGNAQQTPRRFVRHELPESLQQVGSFGLRRDAEGRLWAPSALARAVGVHVEALCEGGGVR